MDRMLDMVRTIGCDHGLEPHLRIVPADPDKAYRCSATLAEADGHECRVNRLTGDVFDRVGRGLRYVGRRTGDDEADVRRWTAWLVAAGLRCE